MPDAQSLINKVVDFYGRYLSCSRDQLDLLALWTFHTHCFQHFPFSPALNIHSREKQSGKTTCLELLQALCGHSSFHTSASPALVIRQTQGLDVGHQFTHTLLLDDCRFTTALQGVLAAGFRCSGVQIARSKNQDGKTIFEERICYFPKAFAGNSRLPDCLRDVSIPIALEPKKPGSPCRRFLHDAPQIEADSLLMELHQWRKDHDEDLALRAVHEEPDFPSELSSRQQDCSEPLIIIADLIGGDWLQRACNALVNAFAQSAFEDFYSSRQVLGDIQEAFAAKDHPEWIASKDLLEFLHIMDDRTWDEWSKGKPLNTKDLAALLAPFGIKSKNHRTGEGDKVAKGYNREDFITSWQKYLPETCGTEACPRGDSRRACPEMPVEGTPGCGRETQGSPGSVAANSQTSSVQPAAVPSCQAKDNSQKPVANSVAADSQERYPSPKGEIIEPSTSVLGNRGNKPESRRDGTQSLQPEKNPKHLRPTNTSKLPAPKGSVAANSQNSSVQPPVVLNCQAKDRSQQTLASLVAGHPRLQAYIQNPARVSVAADSQKLSPGPPQPPVYAVRTQHGTLRKIF